MPRQRCLLLKIYNFYKVYIETIVYYNRYIYKKIIENEIKDLKKYDSLLKEYDDGFNLSKQEDELFQKMKKSLPSYKD
ncbi:hypothetical protein ACT4UL_24055, partial [Bacillus sp. HC-TM]